MGHDTDLWGIATWGLDRASDFMYAVIFVVAVPESLFEDVPDGSQVLGDHVSPFFPAHVKK